MNTKNKFCVSKNFVFLSLIFLLITITIFTVRFLISNKFTSNSRASTIKPKPNLIIGGQPADPGEWPFMTVLYNKKIFNQRYLDERTNIYRVGTLKDALICSSFLISDEWVLTAAHCLYERVPDPKADIGFVIGKINPNNLGIAIGYHNINTTKAVYARGLKQTLVDVKSYVINEELDYKYKYKKTISVVEAQNMFSFPLNSDIALVKINKLKTSNFKTISITDNSNLTMPSTYVELIGWGFTELESESLPDVLHEGVNKIYSNIYTDQYAKPNKIFHILTLQNKPRGYGGDSGSPLLAYDNGKWYAVGVFTNSSGSDESSWYMNSVLHYKWINLVTKISDGQGTFNGKLPDWINP